MDSMCIDDFIRLVLHTLCVLRLDFTMRNGYNSETSLDLWSVNFKKRNAFFVIFTVSQIKIWPKFTIWYETENVLFRFGSLYMSIFQPLRKILMEFKPPQWVVVLLRSRRRRFSHLASRLQPQPPQEQPRGREIEKGREEELPNKKSTYRVREVKWQKWFGILKFDV